MDDCVKFCYTCDSDTIRYCVLCSMPVCVKCVIPNTTKFDLFTGVCKRCNSHKIRAQIRWCGICDELTSCFTSFTFTHPIKYATSSSRDGGIKPTCTSGVYFYICYTCNNIHPSFYKIFKKIGIKKFTEETATHMLALINNIREHRKHQMLEHLHSIDVCFPTELCNLISNYCNPKHHYEYLYVVRRFKDTCETVYDFADDKMYNSLDRYKVAKKITN